MEIDQAGIDFIKQFEGCRLEAYYDQANILTIGYGDTEDVTPGMVITQQDADSRLINRLESFEQGVNELVSVPINQNQFNALCSFSYNVGLASLRRSTLLRCLNNFDFNDAAENFLKWDLAGGAVDPGLERRRQAEKLLFLS